MLLLYDIKNSLSMNPGIGVTGSAMHVSLMSAWAVHVSCDALWSTDAWIPSQNDEVKA